MQRIKGFSGVMVEVIDIGDGKVCFSVDSSTVCFPITLWNKVRNSVDIQIIDFKEHELKRLLDDKSRLLK